MGPFKSQIARSTPFDNSTNSFTATEVQAAIEEAQASAQAAARFTIMCSFNGTVGNNAFLSYSELTPNTNIYVPIACRIKEIAWSSDALSIDGTFDLYKNGRAGGNIVYTNVFSNVNNGKTAAGLTIDFAANDFFVGHWIDSGTNPTDMGIIYFFEVL